MIFGKQRVYENILSFRTLSTVIRTWISRDPEGPGQDVDYGEIGKWVSDNRQAIDAQPALMTAEQLSKKFPRIVAVEVMDAFKSAGVLIYPNWP